MSRRHHHFGLQLAPQGGGAKAQVNTERHRVKHEHCEKDSGWRQVKSTDNRLVSGGGVCLRGGQGVVCSGDGGQSSGMFSSGWGGNTVF